MIQNSEVISVSEPSDLKVRPIVGDATFPTRKSTYLVDILLKPLSKSYIKRSINFFKQILTRSL